MGKQVARFGLRACVLAAGGNKGGRCATPEMILRWHQVWTVRDSTRSRGAHRLICFRRDYQLTIGAERRRRASNDWFSDNEYGPRP